MFRPTFGEESLHDIFNDNVRKLINFAISGDSSKNMNQHTWWAADRRTNTQIDYVIINKYHQSSIKNVMTCRDLNRALDHYFIVLNFSFKLSVEWKRHQQTSKSAK